MSANGDAKQFASHFPEGMDRGRAGANIKASWISFDYCLIVRDKSDTCSIEGGILPSPKTAHHGGDTSVLVVARKCEKERTMSNSGDMQPDAAKFSGAHFNRADGQVQPPGDPQERPPLFAHSEAPPFVVGQPGTCSRSPRRSWSSCWFSPSLSNIQGKGGRTSRKPLCCPSSPHSAKYCAQRCTFNCASPRRESASTSWRMFSGKGRTA